MVRRSQSSVLHDLRKLADVGLIQHRQDKKGKEAKIERSRVYEKVPLARQIPVRYFQDTVASKRRMREDPHRRRRADRSPRKTLIAIPSENTILDLCNCGEDDIHEFKGPGTDIRRVTKEIAAFLHTRTGGMVLYGVRDDGTIAGTDLRRADFDQRLQNSIRNTIQPPATVRVRSVSVLGTELVVVLVSPWNRHDVYFYEGRAYIRKGTNVFEATTQEIRRLHNGQYVV